MKSQDKNDTMYTGGVQMKPIKDNVITFRTDDEIKNRIYKMAEEKEWSISQVVNKICKEYFTEKEGT